MLDLPEAVRAGQARFQYPATFVLFSNPPLAWIPGLVPRSQEDRRMGRRCGRRPVEQDWSGLRGSNPAPGCFAVRGRDGGRPLTCDPDSPTLTARARRGPAVLDAVRTSTDQGARPPRAWEALFGRSLSGGGAGQGVRPLTGGDRCDRCGLLLRCRFAPLSRSRIIGCWCTRRWGGLRRW
jgi:hypothetical protein